MSPHLGDRDPEVATCGGPERVLADDEVRRFVRGQLDSVPLEGRSLCVLVPDATRRCPLPLLLSAVHEAVQGRASRCTVVVALGTHPAMTEPARAALLGHEPGAAGARYPATAILDHAWWDPAALVEVGTILPGRVAELSGGLLPEAMLAETTLRAGVPVRVNRAVVEHDLALIVGPVLPHEVVGFSGGNKYLFPGVSGPELVDVSHWLGALVTSASIIGVPGITPVRALIDEAASMLPTERLALCVVTEPGTDRLHSIAFGPPEGAWKAAVEVSAATHVRYLDAPVARVLSVLAERYEDLWTGAKGFYKVEPVVADGGEVVLFAPRLTEISVSHPGIAEIGYHCRDYFLAHWDRFGDRPWGELAHATHLAGAGTYDAAHGERRRVRVTLATGIPEGVARSVGLGWLDPARVDPEAWVRDPGTLVVHDAGEELYRLR